MSQAAPHYYSLGESAVALALPAPATLAQQRRIWRLAASLAGAPGVLDIIPGMNNLTVSYHPLDFDPDHAFDCLRQHWVALSAADDDAPARQVDIPVCYGGEAGPDLAEVARHTGLTPAEVVKQHCAAEYQVFFMGFQPGFAYLGGLPEALATPRRAQPRTRVPAGSVGIGGSQTGVYPASSPGGWQLIGHTRLKLFDPAATQPTLLQPGDRVRFVCEELRHA